VAASLLWILVAQSLLDNVARQLGGVMQTVNDTLPHASAVALTSFFGPVSSADFPVDVRVQPTVAPWVLAAYALGFLVLPALLTRQRDVT
jgi:hypothetical protein